MIRLLKRIADWLDRRYPAKVVVTSKDYEKLVGQFAACVECLGTHKTAIDAVEKRATELEKSLVAIKELLVNGGMTQTRSTAQSMKKEFLEHPERFSMSPNAT